MQKDNKTNQLDLKKKICHTSKSCAVWARLLYLVFCFPSAYRAALGTFGPWTLLCWAEDGAESVTDMFGTLIKPKAVRYFDK